MSDCPHQRPDPPTGYSLPKCKECLLDTYDSRLAELNMNLSRYVLHRKVCPYGHHLKLTRAGGKECLKCLGISPKEEDIQHG